MVGEQTRELDPFTFFLGYRSAIKPLGGPVKGPDPKYAFHTEYHEYRPGALIFQVTLHDLTVTYGELGIHLNAYVPGSGNNASLATAARFSMTELSRTGGTFEVKIHAVKGVTYAIYGYLMDGTDAQAGAITIVVRELGVLEAAGVPAEAFEPTRFGNIDLQRPGNLIDDRRAPSFLDPVSQIMTQAQLSEDSFAALRDEIGQRDADDRMIWQQAFVLQALGRYGFLISGARGLCLGEEGMDVISLLIGRNHAVVAGVDDICTARADHILLSQREMDFAKLPDDLRGFDFLWSIGTADRMGGAREASLFVENAMRCLRPGGLAVHLMDLSIMDQRPANPAVGRSALYRQEIARIAVTLISRSHEVAQLNFGIAGSEASLGKRVSAIAEDISVPTIPFGLIARRKAGAY